MELDPTSTGETFKFQLYSLTGVEPERQKILVKGGQLKDDTDMSTLGAKPGQTFMMMGTPSTGGANIERPKEEAKFMEDMTEAEFARAEGATPAGLVNLGNTCYMNSTLQTLRGVPELQEELLKYSETNSTPGGFNLSEFSTLSQSSGADLTASLRDLYKQMSDSQAAFQPMHFLLILRQVFPQFAQMSQSGQGYAQQDAEEAWSQIISQLRSKLTIKDSSPEAEQDSSSAKETISFIDKYLAGTMSSTLKCTDPAATDEPAVDSTDTFLKLDCHINKDVNHLSDGISLALAETLNKHSSTLDRDAEYLKTSRLASLPKYLTVHFVRFFWKREARKKAKIMRKVTFPAELDVVDFCTDELKQQLIPVRDKVRQIRKDEEDESRSRKRQKRAHEQEEDRNKEAERTLKAKGPADEKTLTKDKKSEKKGEDTEMSEAVYKTDAEYAAERASALLAQKKELLSLIPASPTPNSNASNKSGLYELRGVVTHQGASADSGHYTSYVKKQGNVDPKTGKRKEEDGKWWWFNDEKVTEVEAEKIMGLSGGGESHSALILLYRAVDLPTEEDVKEL